jgi:hypothetical protein
MSNDIHTEEKAKAERKLRAWVKRLEKAEAEGDMSKYNKAIEKVQYWEAKVELAGWE